MRLGRLPEPTGDIRADAIGQLRWAMGGAGLTIEKLRVMDAVLRLPVMARALDGAGPADAPRVAMDALVAAAAALGDGLHARMLRNALAIDYAGSAKDLTARRLEFVREHNEHARQTGSQNYVAETTRAHYSIEQQMLESLVTALGAPAGGEPLAGTEPRPAAAPSRGMPTPRQLPAATAFFAGRSGALDWLDAQLPDPAAPGVAPTVLAIDGTAGVGKTALALHWAHRVAAAFPDGQLYVDLRGHSPEGAPLAPAAALNRFVLALGVAHETVPADEDQLVAMYRSVTAGRRLLVVLDNAATAEQVSPLVPGEPGCAVLVTSRNALPGLAVRHGARVLTLDALLPDEAEHLIVTLLGADRAGTDPTATAELAYRCAYLPLALRIVAAKLQAEPQETVAGMAERLRGDDRLAALQVGTDAGVAVRAAFDLSYGSLPPDEQRAFRLLGLVPGVDVTPEAAAALLGVEEPVAAAVLDRLAAGHLIGRHARLRYQFHDLLREYAHELCGAAEDAAARDGALARLYAYYVNRTVEATAAIHSRLLGLPGDQPEPVSAPAPFADREAATAWLLAEQPNLTAAVLRAAERGADTAAWQLAYAMRGYFLVRPAGADWLAVGQAALGAARRAGHAHAVSAMHGLLGRAYRQLGNLPVAAGHVYDALAASREAGWPKGEVIAHCTLGGIRQDQGRLEEAIGHHKAALAIERSSGNPDAAATHLANIGATMILIGAYAGALEYCEEALAVFRRIGDERGIAVNVQNIGAIHHQLGRLDEAAAEVAAALAEYRRMDFPDLEAECLCALARICREAGDLAAAERHAAEGLRMARALQEVRVEVMALNALGTVACRAGNLDRAGVRHRAARDVATGSGYRHGRIDALAGLAAVAAARGEPAKALALADEAVADAEVAGLRALEAQALAVRARALFELGDPVAAEAACDRALTIHHASGCRLGEAEVEFLLGSYARLRVEGL